MTLPVLPLNLAPAPLTLKGQPPTRVPGSALLSLSLNEPVGEAQVCHLEGGLALVAVS